MAKKNILVYDDEEKSAKQYEEMLKGIPSLTKAFIITRISNTDFSKAINRLASKQGVFRKEGKI